MVLVLVGSWQIPVTAKLLKKSFTKVQVGVAKVTSSVFHIPPLTPPIHTFFCVTSARSTQTALILPDVTPLFGLKFPLLGPTTSLLEPLSTHVRGERTRFKDE